MSQYQYDYGDEAGEETKEQQNQPQVHIEETKEEELPTPKQPQQMMKQKKK